MNKTNLILASVLAIIFTSILIISSPSSKKTSSSSLTPTPTSTESISPTPNPTADWKTCINSTKNFSINFPQELNFDEKSCNYSLVDYNNVENIEVVDSTTDFQKNWLFSIDVIDSDLSPSDFINNKVCEVPDICSDPIQGILPFSLEIDISSHYPKTDTVFKSNGKIIIFSLSARNPDTKPSAGVRDVYHQILSTFKFINSEVSSDSPEEVVKKYLDASVKGDLTTAKIYCPDIESTALDFYNFVDYQILSSKVDKNPNYYHVYVQFTDKTGQITNKAPHNSGPLEVFLSKNLDGQWEALTWYFYQ